MAAMFHAAAEAGRSLKRFTGHRLGYQLFNEDTTADSSALIDMLHSIRLTVYFPTIGDETVNWTEDDMEEAIFMTIQYLQSGAFHRLLAGMSQLHTLKLNFPNVPGIESPVNEANTIAVLPEIVGTHIWHNLRDFAINHTGATEDELVDFVLRHKSNLRRISISHITLSEGNWNSVFERIAGKCPRLRKVKLSGDFVYTAGDRRWCMYKFARPNEQMEAAVINEALEAYVRDGGAFPDGRELYQEECRQKAALGIAEELEDPDPFEENEPVFRTFKGRTLVKRPEDDGGYDSDGSHISYGSDEFDWEI
ncbi:hypothetical protein EJ03DRAFT_332402 [Teratosphaeria nubilosa]|uniref:F-box domain-containing protein n=1 Tax=Teratosphaeria nubilosa TaxID=161662 RepID=A0A6G1KU98_9PEZI|nr:hypothetical protein EJ03DRAFT_332402 [Teratosphaeria nubilosa]